MVGARGCVRDVVGLRRGAREEEQHHGEEEEEGAQGMQETMEHPCSWQRRLRNTKTSIQVHFVSVLLVSIVHQRKLDTLGLCFFNYQVPQRS